VRFAVTILVSFVANAAALWLADALFGGVDIDGAQPLLIAALVLAVLNVLVKPVLVVLSIPLIILTLGLFLLVVNIIVLALTQWLVTGFNIEGTLTYIGTVIVVWLVNTVVDWFAPGS
jgi:putative membrane protein